MFTYIRLKNFLSFGDVTFDFKKSAKKAKQFVAIYGENGSGKSNFVRSIEFIHHTLTSFRRTQDTQELVELLKRDEESTPVELLDRIMRENDMEYYLASCRTVDCGEPSEVEIGFFLNGYEGIYKLSFMQKLISESLYYFTGKQRGYLFDISADESERITYKFWSRTFLDEKIKEETIDDILKFWGKHSFLGIIVQQISERNDSYIRNTISEYVLNVIDMFMNTTVINNTSTSLKTSIINSKPNNVLRNLQSGKIKHNQLPLLERSERILKDFFTQTYADIKDISYEKEITST